MVALGAVCFASKGIFAKHLYALDITPDVLVTWRAFLALPLFWAWGLYRARNALFEVPRGALLAATSAGILCYCFGSLMDFYALTLIDVSVERVLLFSYPAIVVLFTSMLTRQPPSRAVVVAVLLTYGGILLVVSGLDVGVLRANARGALLVLACAVTYAVYFMISERYTRTIGSVAFTVYSMTGASVALIAWYFSRHPLELPALAPTTWPDMAALVIVGTVAGVFVTAEGVRRIGAQRSAIVSTTGPPAAALMGWLFLGESMHAPQWIGMALIVGGILVLDLTRRPPPPPE